MLPQAASTGRTRVPAQSIASNKLPGRSTTLASEANGRRLLPAQHFMPASASIIYHPRIRPLCGDMEIVHAAELDAAIECRGSKPANLDAGFASPQCHLGMRGDLFVTVRRPDR